MASLLGLGISLNELQAIKPWQVPDFFLRKYNSNKAMQYKYINNNNNNDYNNNKNNNDTNLLTIKRFKGKCLISRKLLKNVLKFDISNW